MSQLAKLSIACCRLREVPADLGQVVSLRFLDMSFNELTTLPQVSARCACLRRYWPLCAPAS